MKPSLSKRHALAARLKKLSVEMFAAGFELDSLDDEIGAESHQHAEELMGASRICKEWAEVIELELDKP